MTDIDAASAAPPAALPRGALGAWWWQGLRSVVLLRPQWAGLQTTPQLVAVLILVGCAANVGVNRLAIDGPANFYWGSLLTSNWFGIAMAAWVCWFVMRQPRMADVNAAPGLDDAQGDQPEPPQGPPHTAALFALLSAQGFVFIVLSALLTLPIYRDEDMAQALQGHWLAWAVWGVPMAWYVVAQLRVLWLAGRPRWGVRLVAAVAIVGGLVLQVMLRPPQHWYPARPQHVTADTSETPAFKLTQDLLEAQPRLLQTKLQALKADAPAGSSGQSSRHQQPTYGAPRLFAITFAPYAEADVFARESKVVAEVMQARFHTAGRTIQLINNRDTSREWPWATPLNLQRTIQRMAQLMDRDNDVLFIHLTSHGARNGQLASDFEPLSIDPVTPQSLKQWLDQAGIKWRVISISACFSGSWIQPLANDSTLVMTAADADHTSYGCGSRSALTFFGRAMYDEQLRQTLSFEQAHAAARKVIDQREREAGKTDGYSNPQIRVGEAARAKLLALEAGLLRSQP